MVGACIAERFLAKEGLCYTKLPIILYKRKERMIEERILKSGERAMFRLRSLYEKYGYLPFKMSKFEEYDLYVRNKEFLQGNGVITFNDTGGELLALKPDVTLSIIKNTKDEAGVSSKVYYDENVYRISGLTHRYKEIMQSGIECIGDIGEYGIFEVVSLALKSLEALGGDFVLDISHMGLLGALLDGVTDDNALKAELIRLISEKNSHEAKERCLAGGVSDEHTELVASLSSMYGRPFEVIERLAPLCKSEGAGLALGELKRLSEFLECGEFSGKVRIDFSVINNMRYYNGIVFKGFLEGIPEGVLSGGQYGALMRRMGRSSDAVGFAINIDLIDDAARDSKDYDVDVLLLYSDRTDAAEVARRVALMTKEGKCVSAQREIPEKLRYKELVRI